MIKMLFRLTLLGLPILILTSVGISSAASLTVLSTSQNVTVINDTITANKIKPAECAGINLVDIRTSNGNGNNNLIIGNGGNNTFSGGGGDDCILGVDGNDTLYGEQAFGIFQAGGDDVIVGGDGNDTIYGDWAFGFIAFGGDDTLIGENGDDTIYGDGGGFVLGGDDDLRGGSDTDVCDGDGGTDTASNCETIIAIP